MKAHYEKLEKDIKNFGIAFYGDGATIKKFILLIYLLLVFMNLPVLLKLSIVQNI
jgi:hypothetical protein